MRWFRWLVIALFVLLPLASGAAAPAKAMEDMSGGWRRTRDGWQRMESFRSAIPYRRPTLHPAVVGTLELLLTMTAMLALSPEQGAKPRTDSSAESSSRGIGFQGCLCAGKAKTES